ncbi:senescence-specific cysteine protease SAG12-like [Hordeum vulgare subsp. vulgare]|uniref:senescence-specific cysteine protease SAG12-like n=1 Tax=Hordeum vulgare subsp. vulgare TaxID=112509 RepID=UPI001D1A59D6|nr:senescence-specific cysteine protease SAG12-like [Hordeum vulgare subsp. vulgare]
MTAIASLASPPVKCGQFRTTSMVPQFAKWAQMPAGTAQLRRFCSHAAASGSPSRPDGASNNKRQHLHSQPGSAGFFHSCLNPQAMAMALAGLSSILSVGLWYMGNNLRPSEVYWVKTGVVSPLVRRQNNCQCCWAMAIVASVEAAHYQNTSQLISLSVQELIDCDTESGGCERGFKENAFGHIQDNGLLSESSYPYMARRSKSGCKRYETEEAAARISGFRFVDPTEDALEKAVAKQPVVVSLQGSDELENYTGGIMDYKAVEGGTGWRHAVLIVGYGTDSAGLKYWRFKNSWGPGWGEGGFGRIRRHVDDERGALGIFMKPGVHPVLED